MDKTVKGATTERYDEEVYTKIEMQDLILLGIKLKTDNIVKV